MRTPPVPPRIVPSSETIEPDIADRIGGGVEFQDAQGAGPHLLGRMRHQIAQQAREGLLLRIVELRLVAEEDDLVAGTGLAAPFPR